MLCLHYALCRSRSLDRAPLTPLALFTVVSDACKIVSMYPYNTPANTGQHRPPTITVHYFPPNYYSTVPSPKHLSGRRTNLLRVDTHPSTGRVSHVEREVDAPGRRRTCLDIRGSQGRASAGAISRGGFHQHLGGQHRHFGVQSNRTSPSPYGPLPNSCRPVGRSGSASTHGAVSSWYHSAVFMMKSSGNSGHWARTSASAMADGYRGGGLTRTSTAHNH